MAGSTSFSTKNEAADMWSIGAIAFLLLCDCGRKFSETCVALDLLRLQRLSVD